MWVKSAGASRTRTVRTGSPALYQMSYRGVLLFFLKYLVSFRSSLSYFIAYFKLSGFNLIARTVLTMYTYGLILLFVLFKHAISPHITAQCAIAYRHAYLLHTSILVS